MQFVISHNNQFPNNQYTNNQSTSNQQKNGNIQPYRKRKKN